MRTTKHEIAGVFGLWVKAVGGRVAASYNDVGGYRLDHAACYGGYRIERIETESGGVSDVFTVRLPAGEFVTALRMAMRSLEVAQLNKRVEHVDRCPKMGNGCAHFTKYGEVK